MAAVGHMYANGRGVAQNNASAIEWFTRAASDDPGPPDASALFGLGYMHLHGYGGLLGCTCFCMLVRRAQHSRASLIHVKRPSRACHGCGPLNLGAAAGFVGGVGYSVGWMLQSPPTPSQRLLSQCLVVSPTRSSLLVLFASGTLCWDYSQRKSSLLV